jgi:hypothetical protein
MQAVPSSIALAFFILTVTTGNWLVAAFATLTITGILGCFFLTFVLQVPPYSLHPTTYTLHPAPHTLHSTP